jgi:bacterioferritin-associated ferredoxin
MYVCQCRGITDHQIRDAVAGGARSVEEAIGSSNARRDCGSCQALIESLFARATGELVGTSSSTARS